MNDIVVWLWQKVHTHVLVRGKLFELMCAKERKTERKQTRSSSFHCVLNGLEQLSLWSLQGVVLSVWCLTLPYLYKPLTGIMSQYNSEHQHRDESATHTCFSTQSWNTWFLAILGCSNSHGQSTLHWKTTCRSDAASLPATGKLSATHGAKTSDTNY